MKFIVVDRKNRTLATSKNYNRAVDALNRFDDKAVGIRVLVDENVLESMNSASQFVRTLSGHRLLVIEYDKPPYEAAATYALVSELVNAAEEHKMYAHYHDPDF